MTRQYYRNESPLVGFLILVALLFVVYLATNPKGAMMVLLLVLVCYFIIKIFKKKLISSHLNNLIEKLKNSGEEDYFKNFITRFGLENGKKYGGYTFRNHNFDQDRINDLVKILKEKEIISKEKDVYTLIEHYVQEKEEQITRESIRKEPQKFAGLSGSDFEKLLYRLFEAMAYKMEWIGRSGDQGGDLIANKNGERTLIQAKCYRDWSTGNDAVQQVVGAMKMYDCSKTKVVTTSHFTPEAISLAKANMTELISKEQLQELLINNLGESWF
jgi:HJR/Mrr/RecB family endonuclease